MLRVLKEILLEIGFIEEMRSPIFPLLFCGLCAQKYWRVRTFAKIHPELKRFFCPKLGEDQKTKKGLHPRTEQCLCTKLREDQQKKGLQPELEWFLCPKSLLSVLLL